MKYLLCFFIVNISCHALGQDSTIKTTIATNKELSLIKKDSSFIKALSVLSQQDEKLNWNNVEKKETTGLAEYFFTITKKDNKPEFAKLIFQSAKNSPGFTYFVGGATTAQRTTPKTPTQPSRCNWSAWIPDPNKSDKCRITSTCFFRKGLFLYMYRFRNCGLINYEDRWIWQSCGCR